MPVHHATDPYGDLPTYTLPDIMDAYDVSVPAVRDTIRGAADTAPDPIEWLQLTDQTNGRIALRAVRTDTTRAFHRTYVVARDDRGWLAAWRRDDHSWLTGLHVRPPLASLRDWLADATVVLPVSNHDLPLPLHSLFSHAAAFDDALHTAKPDRCGGCHSTRYTGTGPTTPTATDFRLRRDHTTADEHVWECARCRTRTYLTATPADTTRAGTDTTDEDAP